MLAMADQFVRRLVGQNAWLSVSSRDGVIKPRLGWVSQCLAGLTIFVSFTGRAPSTDNFSQPPLTRAAQPELALILGPQLPLFRLLNATRS